jgi:aerobic-type carbon monoxide dehydrogenase small subunit (CoxS/CutS family)
MKDQHLVTLTVNGREHEVLLESRKTLADTLRQDLGLTGTHLGCEHGICGACTVLLDGEPVRACLVFGVQADGREVRTVEGLAEGDELTDLQQAFSRHHGLQCGFCTPGFLMLAEAYLATSAGTDTGSDTGSDTGTDPADDGGRAPDREEVRDVVSANLCRCTGYQGIVDAVCEVAASRLESRRAARRDAREGAP